MELRDDECPETDLDQGNLEAWAARGVLLLNTTLTVREGVSGSHRGMGWETFTDRVIQEVEKAGPVFMLWGKEAQRKRRLLKKTPSERIIESPHPRTPGFRELRALTEALELTEGVAFGKGRREETDSETVAPPTEIGPSPRPAQSELLVSELRHVLPFDVRIDPDPAISVSKVGGIAVIDHLIIGTFGGRLRLWLVAVDSADAFERNTAALDDLSRTFRTFPDTTGIALVAKDMSCLLIEPEDCAPQIQVPGGSMVARRYRRPVQPASEAVRAFLNELIPHWDPVPTFQRDAGLTIDAATLSNEFVRAAVEAQRSAGERARKGNPKKDALLALGDREIAVLKKLATGLLEASVKPEEIETQLAKLARKR